MVRVRRIDTQKARAAVRALEVAKENNRSYNMPEVNAALTEMFRGKCYVCENKEGISSFQIEHLIPHRGDVELKYDWNNFFWSCAHCNNIKNDKYDPILDCSQVDVDQKIAFRKRGYFGTEEELEFVALENNIEIENTIQLLHDVYYGSTPQKRLEATNIRRSLRQNLSKFKELIREYEEAQEYEKDDLKYAIRKEIEASAAFAAFKRWLLWDNRERYQELIQFCDLPILN